MVGQDTTISITIDGSSVVGYVYGGGYRGYSAMDTSVYVGVPATEASGSDPLSGMLRIGSIYGGSSVGESSDYLSDAELLIGDARVTIGNLDPDTASGLVDLLYQISRAGTTVVMATHDREMVDSMRKRVIALEAGHVVRDQERGGYGYYGAL